MAISRDRPVFACRECGTQQTQWSGQCTDCGTWNSLEEVRSHAIAATIKAKRAVATPSPQRLQDIDAVGYQRLSTGLGELDRVLGGGLVPGSAVLLGGSPGAGKSTLLIQASANLSNHGNVLYVSAEESLEQVAMRARRLDLGDAQVRLLAESSTESILVAAQHERPLALVVDSIQTVHTAATNSAPGSVSQVRECAGMLIRLAKETQTAVFLVGHVTKEGSLAGPRVLEHLVDCSLLLDIPGESRFRTLRAIKNRFGEVNELGVFAMTEQGMREVRNPSAIFLSRSGLPAPGSVVTVLSEGTRPLLLELQVLADSAIGAVPRRLAVGVDNQRMSMLFAVLHRHGDLDLAGADIFVNVVGGVRVEDTGADLALLLATCSSLRHRALPSGLAVFGEVGLTGEIRPVPGGQERLREAAKHGFERVIMPTANSPPKPLDGIQQLHPVSNLREALQAIEQLD